MQKEKPVLTQEEKQEDRAWDEMIERAKEKGALIEIEEREGNAIYITCFQIERESDNGVR